MNKTKIGRQGETLAAEYLQKNGYEILQRNYYAGHAEIDIIAKNDATLVFVEVKTCRSASFGAPETWVDDRKVKLLGDAADVFLQDYPDEGLDCRFDIIAVYLQGNDAKINHIQDAFWY